MLVKHFVVLNWQAGYEKMSNQNWVLEGIEVVNIYAHDLEQQAARAHARVVENIGVEPMTSSMPWKRSSQLS
jgi:hypothetical protein